jgi:hypothetical protein
VLLRGLATELATDLPSGRLHGAQAGPPGGERPRQPAAQIDVARRWLAARSCVRGDDPHVTGPAAALGLPLTGDEAGLAKAFQVDADAVGMQAEPLGQLVGSGGPAEIAQQHEELGASRLGERLVESGGKVHRVAEFSTAAL